MHCSIYRHVPQDVRMVNTSLSINLGFSWCCGNYCLLAFVLWCGYCSVSFQSFVLRHWCPQHQETTLNFNNSEIDQVARWPRSFVRLLFTSELKYFVHKRDIYFAPLYDVFGSMVIPYIYVVYLKKIMHFGGGNAIAIYQTAKKQYTPSGLSYNAGLNMARWEAS